MMITMIIMVSIKTYFIFIILYDCKNSEKNLISKTIGGIICICSQILPVDNSTRMKLNSLLCNLNS